MQASPEIGFPDFCGRAATGNFAVGGAVSNQPSSSVDTSSVLCRLRLQSLPSSQSHRQVEVYRVRCNAIYWTALAPEAPAHYAYVRARRRR
jgi:hypothetical protein